MRRINGKPWNRKAALADSAVSLEGDREVGLGDQAAVLEDREG